MTAMSYQVHLIRWFIAHHKGNADMLAMAWIYRYGRVFRKQMTRVFKPSIYKGELL